MSTKSIDNHQVYVYCGSYNPIGQSRYDSCKHPSPPYKKLRVHSVMSSHIDFQCTGVVVGGKMEVYPWDFIIGSGQLVEVRGRYIGNVSITPTENPTVKVTLSGELL